MHDDIRLRPGDRLHPGDQIELVAMPDDQHPIPTGTGGTVELVCDTTALTGSPSRQVRVRWDNGRSLMLVVPPGFGSCRRVGRGERRLRGLPALLAT
jgi:hypothetical protein